MRRTESSVFTAASSAKLPVMRHALTKIIPIAPSTIATNHKGRFLTLRSQSRHSIVSTRRKSNGMHTATQGDSTSNTPSTNAEANIHIRLPPCAAYPFCKITLMRSMRNAQQASVHPETAYSPGNVKRKSAQTACAVADGTQFDALATESSVIASRTQKWTSNHVIATRSATTPAPKILRANIEGVAPKRRCTTLQRMGNDSCDTGEAPERIVRICAFSPGTAKSPARHTPRINVTTAQRRV